MTEMLSLLSFQNPWVFTGFLLLPLLWVLIKLTPPQPKKIRFPSLMLLLPLQTSQKTAHSSPWWLILLRLLIFSLFLLFLSGPYYGHRTNQYIQDDVLLIVDNDWTTVANFAERRAFLLDLIEEAKLNNRQVDLVVTAPQFETQDIQIYEHLVAEEAEDIIRRLKPTPMGPDYLRANLFIEANKQHLNQQVIWLQSGMAFPGQKSFLDVLKKANSFELFKPDHNKTILLRPRLENGQASTTFHLLRPENGALPLDSLTLQTIDFRGRVMTEHSATFDAGKPFQSVRMMLDQEQRSKLKAVRLKERPSVSSTYYFDKYSPSKRVGVLTAENSINQPFKQESYFLQKAITTIGDPVAAPLEKLITSERVIVAPGSATFSEAEQQSLMKWMAKGGVLIRFASGAHNEKDTLYPVALSNNVRDMGGAFSWSTPLAIEQFPKGGIFAKISSPVPLNVRRQILPLSQQEGTHKTHKTHKTLATLSDGTPLVTAKEHGKGWVVLLHIAALPDWSDLPLSGAFVQMLDRLINLQTTLTRQGNFDDLPAYKLLDAYGDPLEPEGRIKSLNTQTLADFSPSLETPAGFYGDKQAYKAMNLSPYLPRPKVNTLTSKTIPERQGVSTLRLGPWVLLACFALFFLDALLGLWIRGYGFSALFKTPLVFLLFSFVSPATAQTNVKSYALNNHLAYIQTGKPALDSNSHKGLEGLSLMLNLRTAYKVKQPVGVNLETDNLMFFPFLYWPVTSDSAYLKPDVRKKLKTYIERGGILFIDLQTNQYTPLERSAALKILEQLGIYKISPVTDTHAVTKSFYLLKGFPGRWVRGTVFKDSRGPDGGAAAITRIFVGQNHWAEAWAMTPDLETMYPVIPGGELQREHAFRFGVNLAIYAMTGTYKTDQVHINAVLERLGGPK